MKNKSIKQIGESGIHAFITNRFGQDSVYPGNPTYSDKSSADSSVYCMVSNSNTSFITDLYSGFNIEAVEAKKRMMMVNRDGSNRTGKTEFIITNYNKIK